MTSPIDSTGLVLVIEGEGGWFDCWFNSQQFDSPCRTAVTGSPREYLVVLSTGWQPASEPLARREGPWFPSTSSQSVPLLPAACRRGQGHQQCLGGEKKIAFWCRRRTLRPGSPLAGTLPVEPAARRTTARTALEGSHIPVGSMCWSKSVLQRCLKSVLGGCPPAVQRQGRPWLAGVGQGHPSLAGVCQGHPWPGGRLKSGLPVAGGWTPGSPIAGGCESGSPLAGNSTVAVRVVCPS